ncbi:aspartic and glutamic acid-rich protein-like isoform X2 [Stylophora pistillata]|uniref:aspartic and glutamic acid-rich protein-like isoform X2 n=1 Tax=Stylophora pistillata TaxID=50429 RepID=UPI000C04ED99|nr:aspartic and glutamic acid-rich protein-like isoform X2 [Stylophora pistillata]
MLKIVLVLIFAAFALTTALPLRNTFYEDVDDYSRDFIPKENADFDESAYDGYLLRRDPVERNPDVLGKYRSMQERLYDEYYNRDAQDDESKAEEDLPLEDAEESLYREEEPWTSDDEAESFNAPTEDEEDEAEYYDEEPNDAEVEESEQVEDEAPTNEDEPEEVPDDEAFETAEEGVEAAQDDGADSAPVEVGHKAAGR